MRNAYCHNGHPFNHNQSAGVDLPNDFDNSSGANRRLMLLRNML